MKENRHHKHPKIVRPNWGEFGRNEISILGTNCGEVQNIAQKILSHLDVNPCLYVDAKHQAIEDGRLVNTADNYVQSDSVSNWMTSEKPNEFDRRLRYNHYALIVANGNHFHTKNQIVVLDSKKLESLKRKEDRLTHIIAVLTTDSCPDIPLFIQNKISSETPVLEDSDLNKLVKVVRTITTPPPLTGLVLAGGHSSRMGRDKGLLDFHGKPQREFIYDLLGKQINEVYMSCRTDQINELSPFNPLPDKIPHLGPFGAIISAFMTHPDHAWLVVACDLPMVQDKTIQKLINNRDASKFATAFINQKSDLPEPLITIWEPRAYPRLLQFLGQGYNCPRKVLFNSNIAKIKPTDNNELMNVNTPKDIGDVQQYSKSLS